MEGGSRLSGACLLLEGGGRADRLPLLAQDSLCRMTSEMRAWGCIVWVSQDLKDLVTCLQCVSKLDVGPDVGPVESVLSEAFKWIDPDVCPLDLACLQVTAWWGGDSPSSASLVYEPSEGDDTVEGRWDPPRPSSRPTKVYVAPSLSVPSPPMEPQHLDWFEASYEDDDAVSWGVDSVPSLEMGSPSPAPSPDLPESEEMASFSCRPFLMFF